MSRENQRGNSHQMSEKEENTSNHPTPHATLGNQVLIRFLKSFFLIKCKNIIDQNETGQEASKSYIHIYKIRSKREHAPIHKKYRETTT
jgi:hypothetical protein